MWRIIAAPLWQCSWKGEQAKSTTSAQMGKMENIAVVELILETLSKPHDLISYVTDRLGHDRRYAIDSTKIQTELRWKPLHTPQEGIPETIKWYLENRD